jgi:hypothetical protein
MVFHESSNREKGPWILLKISCPKPMNNRGETISTKYLMYFREGTM